MDFIPIEHVDVKPNVSLRESDISVEEENDILEEEPQEDCSHNVKPNVSLRESDNISLEEDNSILEEEPQEDSSQPSTSSNWSTTTILTKLPKQRRGRPKKNAETQVMYNEDGTSKCMACDQNICEEMWTSHNALNHYNMAWRYGEVPLDLGDESVVIKCLIRLKNFHPNKSIECRKCEFKSTDAKRFLRHFDLCNNVVSDGMVTCAICREQFNNSEFNYHKLRFHNNLAWRIGDRPLEIGDQRLVLQILKKVHKLKKVLYCEHCGTAKKSVFGLLSHQMVCQKSEKEVESLKVECPICGSKVLPASYDSHMRGHKSPPKKAPGEFATIDTEGKSKRHAAQKALDIIDSNLSDEFQYYIAYLNFDEPSVMNMIETELQNSATFKCKYRNCNFSTSTASTNLPTILEHLKCCEQKPDTSQFYICKICMAIRQNEVEIMEHIKRDHEFKSDPDYLEEFDFDSYAATCAAEWEDNEVDIPREKKRVKSDTLEETKIKPRILSKLRRKPDALFGCAYEWYLEFTKESLLGYYIPKNLHSCSVSFKSMYRHSGVLEEFTPKIMQLFQVQFSNNGTYTIFCGGPICSLSWMPSDDLDCNQILAVSVAKGMDDKYQLNQTYEESTVVQFWNFGQLRNRAKEPIEPKFLFGLAVDFGPIWELEWCPSGCYNIETERLGLLAMAASDSFVHIFTIPKISDNEEGMFFKNKPVVTLKLAHCEQNKNNFYASKISWSKAAGHKYIAVGYTNGMVAIFHLENLGVSFEACTTQVLYPWKSFQAHLSVISAITLNYLNGGNRWLYTGSGDREIATWDLNCSEKILCSRRGIVTDGTWMTNWLNCMSAYDESSSLTNNVNVTSFVVRDFLSELMHVTVSPTTISALGASDWLNLIMQGNAVGELVAQPLHQTLYAFNSNKSTRHGKCILGYVKLEKRTEKEPCRTCLYKDTEESFNLVFIDYKMGSFKDFPRASENIEELKKLENDASLYPLQKINKIACNPNLQASTFFAVGYQAGFVRMAGMQFLNDDEQVF